MEQQGNQVIKGIGQKNPARKPKKIGFKILIGYVILTLLIVILGKILNSQTLVMIGIMMVLLLFGLASISTLKR